MLLTTPAIPLDLAALVVVRIPFPSLATTTQVDIGSDLYRGVFFLWVADWRFKIFTHDLFSCSG
jgi:hypothetical protein